jgi:hypothetical protein
VTVNGLLGQIQIPFRDGLPLENGRADFCFVATVRSYGVSLRLRQSAPEEREIRFASLNEVSCVIATGTPPSIGTLKRNEFRAPIQWVLVQAQGCRRRKDDEAAVEGMDRV